MRLRPIVGDHAESFQESSWLALGSGPVVDPNKSMVENTMKYYTAYEYDFNAGHGEVVVHKTQKEEVSIGQEIMLVSIDGNRRRDDYEGFGVIATIKEIIPALNKDYLRVRTDLRDQL